MTTFLPNVPVYWLIIGTARAQHANASAMPCAWKLQPADRLGENIVAALKELDRASLRRWSRRLAVRSAGRIVLVEARDIDRCEAAGNYVEVHAGAQAHLVREALASLAGRLDPEQFVRISRSSIVNIERVRELHPLLSGDFVAVMADGTQVAGSRRFRASLDTLLR